MDDNCFGGQIALVTGAGRGLGAGIAAVLASRGAMVAIADIDFSAARRTADELNANRADKAFPFAVDVSVAADVKRVVERVVESIGAIDILVNNAGVHGAHGLETSPSAFRIQDWDATFSVNVRGTVLMTEAAAECMIPRKQGKIVNISSQAGRGEWPTGSGVLAAASGGAYGASKAAIIHVTQTYANLLGPHSINVNCVCPGSVYTDLWAAHARWASEHHPTFKGMAPEEIYRRSLEERCPLRRPQTPEDIGNAVAFLASEDAMNITGQALNVNGGQRMN